MLTDHRRLRSLANGTIPHAFCSRIYSRTPRTAPLFDYVESSMAWKRYQRLHLGLQYNQRLYSTPGPIRCRAH
jgi:hypothetical protein